MPTLFEQLQKENEGAAPDPGAAPQNTPPANQSEPAPQGAPAPQDPAPNNASEGDPISPELQSRVQREVLSSIFGEDVNDLDQAKSRFTEVRSTVENLQKQNGDYKKMFEERINPFASDRIREFNHWTKKTGIENYDVFSMVKSVDSETAEKDPLRVMVAAEVLENPSYAGKQNIVRQMVLEKLGFESDEAFDSMNDVQKLRVEGEAQKALKTIIERKSIFSELDQPKTMEDIQNERKQALEESKNKWLPVVKSALPNLKSYKIGSGEKAYAFDFEDQQLQKYENVVLDYLAGSGKEVNEDNLREALNVAQQGLILENFNKIVKGHGNYLRTLTQEEYDSLHHNPSARDPKLQDPPQNTKPPVEDPQDRVANWRKAQRAQFR